MSYHLVNTRHQSLFQIYHSNQAVDWAGLLAGQGCWLGRVGVVEADYAISLSHFVLGCIKLLVPLYLLAETLSPSPSHPLPLDIILTENV